MPYLTSAKRHFDEDISRSKALVAHASGVAEELLRSDILRAAWMMAVGACDAYFSDAYGEILSRTMRAKTYESSVVIPDRLNNVKVPIAAILRGAHDGWRWRMAARGLIEEENVLAIEKIRKLFNFILDENSKLINQGTLGPWMEHQDAKIRLFGIMPAAYIRLSETDKESARKEGIRRFEARYLEIFQRRHDCIHNCDRPKYVPQDITAAQADKAREDIEFLVERCHDRLDSEFPAYLIRLGFSAATRHRVLQ